MPRPLSQPDLAALEEVAHRLADAARAAIAPYFRARELPTEDKGSAVFDPVTQADRAAEAAMREILTAQRPQDGVLGEEFGAQEGSSSLIWVLDPIDGTRSFMSGVPVWGVLIALFDGEKPVLGVMDQPYLQERYVGRRGEQAKLISRLGEGALQTRVCGSLDKATIFTTSPSLFQEGVERASYGLLEARCRLARYGVDCYAYAMVASGHADLVVEAGLAPYDIQALIPIVEAAGGLVTNWAGGPAHEGGRVIAAGDPALHAQALKILGEAQA